MADGIDIVVQDKISPSILTAIEAIGVAASNTHRIIEELKSSLRFNDIPIGNVGTQFARNSTAIQKANDSIVKSQNTVAQSAAKTATVHIQEVNKANLSHSNYAKRVQLDNEAIIKSQNAVAVNAARTAASVQASESRARTRVGLNEIKLNTASTLAQDRIIISNNSVAQSAARTSASVIASEAKAEAAHRANAVGIVQADTKIIASQNLRASNAAKTAALVLASEARSKAAVAFSGIRVDTSQVLANDKIAASAAKTAASVQLSNDQTAKSQAQLSSAQARSAASIQKANDSIVVSAARAAAAQQKSSSDIANSLARAASAAAISASQIARANNATTLSAVRTVNRSNVSSVTSANTIATSNLATQTRAIDLANQLAISNDRVVISNNRVAQSTIATQSALNTLARSYQKNAIDAQAMATATAAVAAQLAKATVAASTQTAGLRGRFTPTQITRQVNTNQLAISNNAVIQSQNQLAASAARAAFAELQLGQAASRAAGQTLSLSGALNLLHSSASKGFSALAFGSRAVRAIESDVRRASQTIRSFASGFLLLSATGGGIRALDTARETENRLRIAAEVRGPSGELDTIKTQERLDQLFKRVKESAIEARAPIKDFSEAFLKMDLVLSDFGLSQEKTIFITSAFSKALRSIGYDAVRTSQVLNQLGETFSQRILNSDEFRRVREALPGLVRQLAIDLGGGDLGVVTELAGKQELTLEKILPSILKFADTVEERFKQSSITIGAAFTQLFSKITNYFRDFDFKFKVSDSIISFIDSLGTKLPQIGRGLAAFGVGLTVLVAPSLLAGLAVITSFLTLTPAGQLTTLAGYFTLFADKIKLSSDGVATLQDGFFAFVQTISELKTPDFLKEIFNETAAQSLFNSSQAFIQQWIDGINILISKVEGFSSAWSNLSPGGFNQMFGEFMDSIAPAFENMLISLAQKAVTFFHSVWEALVDSLKTALGGSFLSTLIPSSEQVKKNFTIEEFNRTNKPQGINGLGFQEPTSKEPLSIIDSLEKLKTKAEDVRPTIVKFWDTWGKAGKEAYESNKTFLEKLYDAWVTTSEKLGKVRIKADSDIAKRSEDNPNALRQANESLANSFTKVTEEAGKASKGILEHDKVLEVVSRNLHQAQFKEFYEKQFFANLKKLNQKQLDSSLFSNEFLQKQGLSRTPVQPQKSAIEDVKFDFEAVNKFAGETSQTLENKLSKAIDSINPEKPHALRNAFEDINQFAVTATKSTEQFKETTTEAMKSAVDSVKSLTDAYTELQSLSIFSKNNSVTSPSRIQLLNKPPDDPFNINPVNQALPDKNLNFNINSNLQEFQTQSQTTANAVQQSFTSALSTIQQSESVLTQNVTGNFSRIGDSATATNNSITSGFASAASNATSSISSAASSIISDFNQIESAANAAADAADRLSGSGGGSGGFSGGGATPSGFSTSGFATGGYTGDIGPNEIAGPVHGQEFVVDATNTKRYRPLLEAIQSGRSLSGSSRSSGAEGEGSRMNVTIQNYGGAVVETKRLSDTELLILIDQRARQAAQEESPSVIANQIRNPNSQVSKSISRSVNANRRR